MLGWTLYKNDFFCEAAASKGTDKYTEERLRELHGFFAKTTTWYAQVAKLPASALLKLMNLGDKMLKLLGAGG
jgi:hypothetical protein